MMVGVVAAQLGTMTDCFLCVLNWVVLPLFIFVVIMSYVLLGGMSIGAAVNADFCGGESSTPDQVLVNLMINSGFSQTDLFFQTVRYYANQCTVEAKTDPYLFLRNFDAAIVRFCNPGRSYLGLLLFSRQFAVSCLFRFKGVSL